MSQHDDGVRLRHMLDACRGRSNADLHRDAQLALALTRLVEIIGEAAKNVSAETRAKRPQVPWRAIAGTRDGEDRIHPVMLRQRLELLRRRLGRGRAGRDGCEPEAVEDAAGDRGLGDEGEDAELATAVRAGDDGEDLPQEVQGTR